MLHAACVRVNALIARAPRADLGTLAKTNLLRVDAGRLLPQVHLMKCVPLFESERGTSHGIKPSPDARVAGREFALLLEGDFQPEPRKMKNTEWPGNTGADHWNVCVGHSMILLSLPQGNCKFARPAEHCLIRCRYSAWVTARRFRPV